MNKKCLFPLITIALLLLIVISPAVSAETPETYEAADLTQSATTTTESINVRVGIYENSPKIFMENGTPAGFWPEIVNYIASQEGWHIEWVLGTWTECLERLERNEIDLMPDVAYNEARSQIFDFSAEGVYTSWSMIFTKEGANIQSLLDLDGKKLAVMKGSVNYEGANGIKQLITAFNVDCTFVEKDGYAAVLEAVQKGEADGGATSKDFGFQHAAQYGLVETPILFQPSNLYFAFSKNAALTPYLIERVDVNIKTIKADRNSVYYEALNKWISGSVVKTYVMPSWAISVIAGVAWVCLVAIIGVFLLRSRVNARTKELRAEIVRREAADKELDKYRQHLEDLVKVRTSELAEKTTELELANEHLQEMDRLKSVFLASMSHELRTPLNSIIGFTGIMLMGMSGELNEEQKKQLTLIKNSSSHLLSLINDILDISKIEANKVELTLDEFKLKDLFKEAVEPLVLTAGGKGIQLISSVPDDTVIYGDKRRMKQVLLNLVSNAVKFTERGSVNVIAKVLDSDTLEIKVIDTGVGIKPDEMGKLFQPFQQVGTSLTKKYEGTGLGLYLSSKLVSLMGGKISAGSEYGKGSEFTWVMPLRK